MSPSTNGTNKIKIYYLKALLNKKDLVIKNQAVAIKSLQDLVTHLQMQISISNEKTSGRNTPTWSNSVEPGRSLGSFYTHLLNTDLTINVSNKTNNSQHFENVKDRITTVKVANAVHLAESSNKCSDIIN